MKAYPTVALVDDDASVRRGLSRLLRSHHLDVELFESGEALLARDTIEDIGCIVLDVQMPGLDGLELQQHLAADADGPPIVFLTGHGDIPMTVQAMQHGASNFLTKPVDERLLLEAIHAAFEQYSGRTERRLALDAVRHQLVALTPREREVLEYIVSGARNREIAAHLGIALKTVKVHRGRVMEKLQVKTVVDLIHLCTRLGVEPKKITGPL